MSRIGNKPIKLENGVTFSRNENEIVVSGPKGTLKDHVDKNVVTEVKDNELHFTYTGDYSAKQGLASRPVFRYDKA